MIRIRINQLESFALTHNIRFDGWGDVTHAWIPDLWNCTLTALPATEELIKKLYWQHRISLKRVFNPVVQQWPHGPYDRNAYRSSWYKDVQYTSVEAWETAKMLAFFQTIDQTKKQLKGT